MVLTKKPLVAEMVGSGVNGPTNKLDDVIAGGAAGVGTLAEPGIVAYEADRTVLIKRVVMSNHDFGGNFTMNKFADISLANGFKLVKVTASTEIEITGPVGMRNYAGFVEKGFRIERDVNDADWFQLVLDCEDAYGVYIKLRAGERLELRNRDDISAVSHVACSVNGFIG